MYTVQGLWTMAREGLRVTTVVFANRDYAVLKREFSGLGVGDPGRRALDVRDRPSRSRLGVLGEGYGGPRQTCNLARCIHEGAAEGFESQGPMLIEVPL